MKLLCDHMLGSLARWLRLMGYDTEYPQPGPDRELIDRAHREERILLTRDKMLAARVPGAVRVRSDDLDAQIREVAAILQLGLVSPLTRCSLCNVVLVPVALDEIEDRIPEGVRARHDKFWRCPACERVYWQGSHWDKMVERLNHLDLPRPS